MKEPTLHCPRCGVPMEKIKRGDTTLDVCRTCGGMWLDKGEMERLAAHGKKTQ